MSVREFVCLASSCQTVNDIESAPRRTQLAIGMRTMQTQSTPSNQPPFPDPSLLTRSSSPSLPLSSIPSKHILRFTGSSLPVWKWYWRTLSHPRIGPLSSDDPRPMSWPLVGCTTKVNGSVSHPSVLFAYMMYRSSKYKIHTIKIEDSLRTGCTSK